jgi:hypothetical protein
MKKPLWNIVYSPKVSFNKFKKILITPRFGVIKFGSECPIYTGLGKIHHKSI